MDFTLLVKTMLSGQVEASVRLDITPRAQPFAQRLEKHVWGLQK
jgi:hypothetical protein